MRFIPWQHISDWKCNSCGQCCKLYSVVLRFPEWLRIVKSYGVEKTVPGLDKLFIKRVDDGTCSFLCQFGRTNYCGLQHMKPDACKLWPFKVLADPRYGQAREAKFNHREKQLFIYADSMCSGLKYGNPTWEFQSRILKEFADIAFGNQRYQVKTTRKLPFTF